MLNLDNNYCSSDEAYIKPAGTFTADHSAKWHMKALKISIENLTDLPELPKFNPSQSIVPSHKAWNQLHIMFSVLDAIALTHIFNLFLTNSMMGQLVGNSTSYAQLQ